MRKFSALIVAVASFVSLTARADVTVKYNNDGSAITCMTVVSPPDQSTKFKIEAKTTGGTVTIPGTAPVRIACPITKSGAVATLSGGETITFRLGKIGPINR